MDKIILETKYVKALFNDETRVYTSIFLSETQNMTDKEWQEQMVELKMLIEKYKPLWNTVLDGFGNHDPGSGRYKQQVSPWDVLHPGRSWAAKLQDGKAVQEIKKLIEDYRIKYEKK